MRKRTEAQIRAERIREAILSMGADRVEILEDSKAKELHVAVIRRPNPGRIYINVRRFLGKLPLKVIVHINPTDGRECKNTHVNDRRKGIVWKNEPMIPVEGLL